jgi:hypothetical protein
MVPPYPPICKSGIEIERGKRKLRQTPTIILDWPRRSKREDVDMIEFCPGDGLTPPSQE